MEKALEMGKTSARGSFHLFIGVVISDVVLVVGTIDVTRLLAPEQYGLYAVALIAPGAINPFRDWGTNAALTKYIASHKEAENQQEIYKTNATGIAFEISMGFVL